MTNAERVRYAIGYAKSALATDVRLPAHDADVLAELDALEPYLLAALAVAQRHPGELAALMADDDEPTLRTAVGCWA